MKSLLISLLVFSAAVWAQNAIPAETVSPTQQGNSQSPPRRDSHNATDRRSQQDSPAYQRGYQQGEKDRSANIAPSAADSNWKHDADRLAYRSGYRAGYCHDQASRTGYYNGTYRDYAPPVIRNGYYGYNAPDPYCENGSGDAPHRQDKPGPQNTVEYGGAG